MRILSTVIVFILLTTPVFSQKQFEGTIVYDFPAQFGKDGMKMKVAFGKNAIKISFDVNTDNNDVILVRIDSGKVYHLSMDDKTYGVRKLKQQDTPAAVPPKKEILGYTTSPSQAAPNSALSTLSLMFGSDEAFFYTADSLFYTVPDKYASNLELVFIHKGKIILGAEMKTMKDFSDDVTEAAKEKQVDMSKIIIQASSVKWEPISDAELSLPAGFVKMEDGYVTTDSTYAVPVIPDSVASTPQKNLPKKPAGSSKKPVTPSKKASSKPTDSIRKPE